MTNKIRFLGAILSSIFIILAPVTNAISDEMKINVKIKKFNSNELTELLVGNSYPLGGTSLDDSKGAFYFASDTELLIRWEGKKGKGKWSANNKSQFCYTQSLWSGEECITLLENISSGGYIHIFDGKNRVLKPDALREGNSVG